MPDITIKTTAVYLNEVCSKYAKFSSWVENPPMEIVENEWQTASNQDIPKNLYKEAHIIVIVR